MEIIRLRPDQYQYFKRLDIVFMMGTLSVAGGFALGGIIHDEERNVDLPVGLLLANQIGNTIMVQWLCIDEDYRGQGLGSEMLNKLVDLAAASGIDTIGAYFRDTDSRKFTCPHDKKYFREYGFIREESLGGEWIGDIKTMVRNNVKDEIRPGLKMIRLSDLPRFRIKEAVDRIIASESTDYFYVVDKNYMEYDENLSFLLTKDEELVGAILINGNDNFLYPICIMAENEADVNALIDQALYNAQTLNDRDKTVCITLKTDKYLEKVKGMMPTERMRNFAMYASVSDLIIRDRVRSYDIFAEISLEDMEEEDNSLLSNYLKKGTDQVITVNELAGINRLKDFESSAVVEDLGQIDMKDMHRILIDCRYGDNFSLFEDIPLVPNLAWFDEDMSCCIRVDGSIACILLVTVQASGDILPLLLYSSSKKYAPLLVKLMLRFKQAAIRKFPGDTRIILRSVDDKHSALYKSILG